MSVTSLVHLDSRTAMKGASRKDPIALQRFWKSSSSQGQPREVARVFATVVASVGWSLTW